MDEKEILAPWVADEIERLEKIFNGIGYKGVKVRPCISDWDEKELVLSVDVRISDKDDVATGDECRRRELIEYAKGLELESSKGRECRDMILLLAHGYPFDRVMDRVFRFF